MLIYPMSIHLKDVQFNQSERLRFRATKTERHDHIQFSLYSLNTRYFLRFIVDFYFSERSMIPKLTHLKSMNIKIFSTPHHPLPLLLDWTTKNKKKSADSILYIKMSSYFNSMKPHLNIFWTARQLKRILIISILPYQYEKIPHRSQQQHVERKKHPCAIFHPRWNKLVAKWYIWILNAKYADLCTHMVHTIDR